MLIRRFNVLVLLFTTGIVFAETPERTLILEDSFEREESHPEKEEVGNGWGTNSKSRAKGEKQVDLDQGAMHVTRATVADHGVSIHHDLEFKDATIQLRFLLGPKDDLGINIADMQEKSVHAGHLCMCRIKMDRIELVDLKTGRMNKERRQRRLDDKLTDEDRKAIATRSKYIRTKLQPESWHTVTLKISGDTMTVTIDGKQLGEFQSEGIGHPTKRRLRLAVNQTAWIDDVKVWKE